MIVPQKPEMLIELQKRIAKNLKAGDWVSTVGPNLRLVPSAVIDDEGLDGDD